MAMISLSKVRHLLCLGAHADDIEIGCGGTIWQLLREKPDLHVTWIVFSGNEVRRLEAIESANRWRLGLSQDIQVGTTGPNDRASSTGQWDVRVESFPDSQFPSVGAEIKSYFSVLARSWSVEQQPDLIFTHRLEDRHQDHRLLAELTWQSFRNHNILEYEIPKYEGDLGQPNVYVPLAPQLVDKKCNELMSAFPSQREKPWFEGETFRSLMRIRGLEAGGKVRYAEAFHARKMILGSEVRL